MAKLSKQTEENISQLQVIEQNLQNLLLQSQSFQMQLMEIDNALKELEKTKEMPFKIVGSLMVATNKDELKKELASKKEVYELRIKSFEKQEEKLRERANSIQQVVMKEMQKTEVDEK